MKTTIYQRIDHSITLSVKSTGNPVEIEIFSTKSCSSFTLTLKQHALSRQC